MFVSACLLFIMFSAFCYAQLLKMLLHAWLRSLCWTLEELRIIITSILISLLDYRTKFDLHTLLFSLVENNMYTTKIRNWFWMCICTQGETSFKSCKNTCKKKPQKCNIWACQEIAEILPPLFLPVLRIRGWRQHTQVFTRGAELTKHCTVVRSISTPLLSETDPSVQVKKHMLCTNTNSRGGNW